MSGSHGPLRAMQGSAGAFRCGIETHPAAEPAELRAPVVIMANGSWEGDRGGDRRAARRSGDLFAFKANFSGSRLGTRRAARDFVCGRLWRSCHCRERSSSRLRAVFAVTPLKPAGPLHPGKLRAKRSRICAHPHGRVARCPERRAARRQVAALDRFSPVSVRRGIARMGGSWLATRRPRRIPSSAKASAWRCSRRGSLCVRLVRRRVAANASADTLQRVGADYARQWRRAFAPRLHLAATVAHLAMKPWLAAGAFGRPWCAIAAAADRDSARRREGANCTHLQGVPPLGEIRSLEDVH